MVWIFICDWIRPVLPDFTGMHGTPGLWQSRPTDAYVCPQSQHIGKKWKNIGNIKENIEKYRNIYRISKKKHTISTLWTPDCSEDPGLLALWRVPQLMDQVHESRIDLPDMDIASGPLAFDSQEILWKEIKSNVRPSFFPIFGGQKQISPPVSRKLWPRKFWARHPGRLWEMLGKWTAKNRKLEYQRAGKVWL